MRDLVGALNDAGWQTVDSGDGVSKQKMDGVLSFAHVVVRIDDPSRLVPSSHELYGWLRVVNSGTWANWIVEASYAPHDGAALLLLREGA